MTKLIETIGTLGKKEHIIIGSILKKYPTVKMNENKGGIMINITTVPPEAISEIETYLSFVFQQIDTLQKIETKANDYYEQYFKEVEDDD